MSTDNRHQKYWQTNLRILGILLACWFLFGFVLSIFLAKPLNEFHIGGFPLGFWIAQQGAMISFIVLIFIYAWLMGRVDAKFRQNQPPTASQQQEQKEEKAS